MSVLHLLVALAEFTVALLYLHRLAPTMRYRVGRHHAFMMLAMGMALGFAGVGQLVLFLNGETHRLFLTLGHGALLYYAIERYRDLSKLGLEGWVRGGRDG